MAPISKSDFADMLGVDRSRVSQLVRQGLPTTAGGKIDVEQGLSWVSARVDTGRYPNGTAVRATDLLRHLKASREREVRPLLDPGEFHPNLRWLTNFADDPVPGVITAGAVMMAYRAPAVAACLAVQAGASLKTAYALRRIMMLAMAEEAQDVVPVRDGTVEWNLNAFHKVNWQRVAEEFGCDEPVDTVAWERHTKAIFGSKDLSQ